MMFKKRLGQSQLLIPLVIILTSIVVLATNMTINVLNSTLNGSNSGITGNMIGIPQTVENSFPIEVWANTSIKLDVVENLVIATLFLDNGTLLENEQIDFYLNDSSIYSLSTDVQGTAEIPKPDNGIIKVSFNGNPSLFFNPSESEIEIIKNVTENEIIPLKMKIGEIQKIGDLEITLENYSINNYTDWDYESSEKVEKSYHEFFVKVFNNFSKPSGIYSFEDKIVLNSVKLADDLGNEYEPIPFKELSFDIRDLQEIDKDTIFYPQTIKEGYIIFSGIDEKANKISLIFETADGIAIFDSEELIK